MNASLSLLSKPGFSLYSLIRTVWKHKFLAIAVAIVIAPAGIVVTYRLPAVYKAEAMILVDPQKVPERFVATTVNVDVQERLSTISQEILSSTRLQEIINNFNLYPKERETRSPEELVEMMKRDLHIDLEKGMGGNRPGAFRVSYQGADPVVVAQVVNQMTQFYIDENLRARGARATGTSDFIVHELREAKQTLETQEAALSRYKVEHSGELPEQESSLIAMSTQLQIQLQGNQDATNRAQQEKIVLENALNSAEVAENSLRPRVSRASVSSPSKDEPEQAAPPPQSKYRKEYDGLEAELAALRVRGYSDEHPDVVRLRSRIAGLQRVLNQDEARIAVEADQIARGVRPIQSSPAPDPVSDPMAVERSRAHERTTTLQSQLASVKRDLQNRQVEREKILRTLDSYQRRIEHLPLREQEMASLTRDYEISRNYYSSLFAKKTDAEMASDLEKRQKAETFRVLDAAKPPSRPFKPNRLMYSSMSIFFGLVLGVAAAIGREYKAGVLLGEWELPAGVVVLGRVPRIQPTFSVSVTPDEPRSGTSGTKERSGKKHPLAILSWGTVLVLGLAVMFFWHRI